MRVEWTKPGDFIETVACFSDSVPNVAQISDISSVNGVIASVLCVAIP